MTELLNPSVILKKVFEDIAQPVIAMPNEPDAPSHPLLSSETYAMGQWVGTYRGQRIIQHTGDVVGYAAGVLRLPDHGLAYTIIINDNTFSTPLRTIIGRRLIDSWTALEPYDWEDWEMKGSFKPAEEDGKDDADTSGESDPNADPTGAKGTYRHGAYSDLELRVVDNSSDQLVSREAFKKACKLSGTKINLDGPTYFSQMSSMFCNGVLFTHHCGPVWTWTQIYIYPNMESESAAKTGRIPTYSMGQQGKAVFVPSDSGKGGSGLGMFGLWWGQSAPGVAEREYKGEMEVKTSCEVWYDRI